MPLGINWKVLYLVEPMEELFFSVWGAAGLFGVPAILLHTKTDISTSFASSQQVQLKKLVVRSIVMVARMIDLGSVCLTLLGSRGNASADLE